MAEETSKRKSITFDLSNNDNKDIFERCVENNKPDDMVSNEEVVLSDIPENIPDISDIPTEYDLSERRNSIFERIKEKQNDQDFKQKTNVFITLMLEIYRVLMGAFLVAFVPQKCHDTICTLNENVSRTDNFSVLVVSMNGATFLVFLRILIFLKDVFTIIQDFKGFF